MANVLKLKKQAAELGMDKNKARGASRKELEDFIANAKKGGGKVAKKKAAGKKAPAKRKPAERKQTRKPQAKKTTTRKPTSKPKASSRKQAQSNGDGRHIIGKLNFSKTEGWNPRDGSPVALIFKTLKRNKGDVDKTTDQLMPQVSSLLTTVKDGNGKRLSKDALRNRLKYRVNRTKWEFATRTGQHAQSENRVEYGTGDYAQAQRKASRKRTNGTKPKKSATKSRTSGAKGRKKAGSRK